MNRIYIFYGVAIITLGLYNVWAFRQQKERAQFYHDASFLFHESSLNFKEAIKTYPKRIRHFYKNRFIPQQEFSNLKTIESVIDKDQIPEPEQEDTAQIDVVCGELQKTLSVHQELIRTYNRLSTWPRHPDYGCMPELHLDQACLKAGELVTGSLQPQFYSKYSDHIMMQVNGKNVILNDGKAPFVGTFSANHQIEIPLSASLQNPVQGNRLTYQKNYRLEICQ